MIYLTLFLEFFKIGLFCFGGGFGMIPLMKETVLQYAWLTESEFYNFIGVCESTPGPIAVNMATYIGSTQAGLIGSICATLGVVLPSFLIILLVASVLKQLTKHRCFKAFMRGARPVVIGLILSAGISLLIKAFGYVSLQEFQAAPVPILVFALLILACFLAQRFFHKKLSAIQLILLSVLLGIGCSVLAEAL